MRADRDSDRWKFYKNWILPESMVESRSTQMWAHRACAVEFSFKPRLPSPALCQLSSSSLGVWRIANNFKGAYRHLLYMSVNHHIIPSLNSRTYISMI